MNSFTRFAGSLSILALSALPALAASDINGLLEKIRDEYKLPSLAAAVVKNGEVVAAGAVGTRVVGMDLPVTVNDRYHLGSDTKAMTATIAGTLVDEGKLRWDSTVGEVLGSKIKGMSDGLKAVTLQQLLSHSSGIPTDNDEILALYFNVNAFDHNPDALRLMAIDAWKANEPKVPEGSPFQYSNLGYLIAGAMIDTAAGKPWEVLMHERIFEPLGLTTAGLGPQATYGLYDAPMGHRLAADGSLSPATWGAAADVPPMLGPAGNAHMSVIDFARWGGWNASGGTAPQIVTSATLGEIHRAHVQTPKMPNPPPGTPGEGEYAFGWGLSKFDWADYALLSHNGSNGMNLAKILVDTKTGLAIATVTNQPGSEADRALSDVVQALYTEQK